MAVNVYDPSSVREYIGLSTDAKPSNANSGNGSIAPPRTGDRFIETDTGKVYVFNATAWSAAVLNSIFTAGG